MQWPLAGRRGRSDLFEAFRSLESDFIQKQLKTNKMKTIISALILMLVLLVSAASCSDSTASTSSDGDATVTQNVKISGPVAVESVMASTEGNNFFAENWGALLMGLLGFYDLVARLTPTSKNNSIVSFLTKLLNVVIPNVRKGGGVF